jgi:hypothetical protein
MGKGNSEHIEQPTSESKVFVSVEPRKYVSVLISSNKVFFSTPYTFFLQRLQQEI